MDALASALFALKSLSHLFIRVINSIEGKDYLKEDVIEHVLLKETSISDAILAFQKKEEKINVQEEEKTEQQRYPLAVLRLYDRITKLEKEIMFLKNNNRYLDQKTQRLGKEKEFLQNKLDVVEYGHKNKKIIQFKEKRQFQLTKEIEFKNMQIQSLSNEVALLNSIIARIKSKTIIKKIKNFGTLEFQKANAVLNISEGDVLFVGDPSEVSQKVKGIIDQLQVTIITDSHSSQKSSGSSCLSMEKAKLGLETEHYFVADKRQFEEALNSKKRLYKIIEDYQESRR